MHGVQPPGAARQCGCCQPGGVDHRGGLQARAIVSYYIDSVLRTFHERYSRIDCQHSTGLLDIGQQAQHQRVAVHNAGVGRVQCGHAFEGGLQGTRLVALQPLQCHAIAQGMGLHGAQGFALRIGGGHHQLAAALVGNGALGAIGVQQLAPLHAQPRLE